MVTSDFTGVSAVTGARPTDGGLSYAQASNYHPPRICAPNGDIIAASSSGWPINPATNVSATIAARTNPSRPSLIPGMMLQDLVSLPSMLRGIGNALREGKSAIGLHGVANRALAAKFGWLPLFQDIGLLLTLQSHIDKRHDELNRLFSGSGLKRRIRVNKLTSLSSSTQFVSSGFPLGTAGGRLDVTNTSEQWGVCRWKPSAGTPPFPTYRAQREMASRIVHGATASGAFASSWDLIPWTWLMGWAVNTRDYVLAHGNTVPVVLDGPINMMIQTKQTRSIHSVNYASGFSGGEGDAVHDWKTRKIYPTVSHSAHIPYINGGRLSTLSLLAVQRLRR
nr:MAG: putative maturation protein [Leviviridae sp.]